jgi:hypothetical protein
MTAISKRQLQIGVIFMTLAPLYLLSYRWSTPQAGLGATNARDVASYAKTALGVQVDDPFNISAVAALCAEQKNWRPNLFITIDDANGGIGNVRSAMIDFLYFAMSAGTSIVAPPVQRRSDRDLSSLWNGKLPFDTFFDVENLVSVLNQACPQMVVYRTQEEFQGYTCPSRFGPGSLRSDLPEEGLAPQAFFKRFEDFLVQQNIVDDSNKTLVLFGRTLWDSIDTHTRPHLRRAIGRLVQLRPDVRRLAETIIANMGVQHNMPISPSSRIHKNAFMGAHLRTETDARNAHWLDRPEKAFEGQTDTYLSQALASGLQVIYAASGNETELENFAAKAREQYKFIVTWKQRLLNGRDLHELNSLMWDQQGLVDYEVMMKCSVFGGFVHSSFSWNIAMRRHESVGHAVEVKRANPYWMRNFTEGVDLYGMERVSYDDGLSRIWGRDEWAERKIIQGMWP